MEDSNKLLNAKEVANILGVSPFTVSYTLAGNELNYVKVCNKRMFKMKDIQNYIDRNTVSTVMNFRIVKQKYVV